MRAIIILTCLTVYTTIAVLAQSDAEDQVDLGRASLDTVWQTVYEYHYDTTFGGLDWREIHDRYYELAAAAEDGEALMTLMNQMLLELKLSHYAVFRVEDEASSGSPVLSAASIGIDLRLLGDEAVITALDPGFPAAQAGMKPGYQIKSLNGISVQQILSDAAAKHIPHFNERHKKNSMCDAVVSYCFGQPGDTVVITYEDETGAARDTRLQMKQRTVGTKISEQFPTVYVDFKAEPLAGNFGYIYFSAFFPPADSLFLAALDSMSDIRGLIIDIRGNPGGMHQIGESIASKLVSERTLFSVFRYRDSTLNVSVDPDPPVFDGPIAILIDVMNGSASERFAACMQSIGRGKIIGEQSPGSVGPSDLKKLPNGASFMYLKAQSLTPDGTVLEGRGVIPDITVPLDRIALLKGVDTQIERAIDYLKSEID
ncbi:MAG: S41 family peptidase [Phycisphaerae bacterium]|nr:S41 family peptidase [Phycisphaerae bacterium]